MTTIALPASLRHDSATACAKGWSSSVAQASAADISVWVDASALTHFDSSALAVLLQIRREALANGQRFAVMALPEALGRLAKVYGVSELLTP